jgi:pyruvate dehydrogenase E1 component beta subunit
VRKTGRLVAIQEAPPMCGIASEVVATVTEAGAVLQSPPARVTGKQAPIAFSPPLEDAILPHAGDIVQAVKRIMA